MGNTTKAKTAMLAIFTSLKKHDLLTYEEVLLELTKRGVYVNRATVFRNLNAFVESGILKRMYIDSVARYELANLPHHHHAICERCGAVEEIRTCVENNLKGELKHKGFAPKEHVLEVYGLCKHCQ